MLFHKVVKYALFSEHASQRYLFQKLLIALIDLLLLHCSLTTAADQPWHVVPNVLFENTEGVPLNSVPLNRNLARRSPIVLVLL